MNADERRSKTGQIWRGVPALIRFWILFAFHFVRFVLSFMLFVSSFCL